MCDLGDKLDDAGIAALGEAAEEYRDPRECCTLAAAPAPDCRSTTTRSDGGSADYTPIGPEIDSATMFAIIRQESMFNPADYWPPIHGLMR
jgi:hypothetical protein